MNAVTVKDLYALLEEFPLESEAVSVQLGPEAPKKRELRNKITNYEMASLGADGFLFDQMHFQFVQRDPSNQVKLNRFQCAFVGLLD